MDTARIMTLFNVPRSARAVEAVDIIPLRNKVSLCLNDLVLEEGTPIGRHDLLEYK